MDWAADKNDSGIHRRINFGLKKEMVWWIVKQKM
jgi:hypothetical protein